MRGRALTLVTMLATATIFAHVSVYQLRRHVPGRGTSSVAREKQEVCATRAPVKIPIEDIRGREAEWYDRETPAALICTTTYRGRPARITVRPAVVIRHWPRGDLLDAHAHVALAPEGDDERALDYFVQALTPNLGEDDLTLNLSAGGVARRADQDAYYVRIEFRK